jgi:hypothetical protein
MTFKNKVCVFTEQPLNRQIMMDLLKEYNSPSDKINELVKKGELTIIKKDLYITGPRIYTAKPEPFLIANHLWGPSYVSLEAALSYWGLIPERVYEISSMTTKAAKNYQTPVGRFSYFQAPLPYYSFGIKRVQLTPKQVVLIASPEKAICDLIINTSGLLLRSQRQAREYLVEDLRIDEEMLAEFDLNAICSWIENAPKKRSLTMLVKAISGL